MFLWLNTKLSAQNDQKVHPILGSFWSQLKWIACQFITLHACLSILQLACVPSMYLSLLSPMSHNQEIIAHFNWMYILEAGNHYVGNICRILRKMSGWSQVHRNWSCMSLIIIINAHQHQHHGSTGFRVFKRGIQN